MKWICFICFMLLVAASLVLLDIQFRDIWDAMNVKSRKTLKDAVNILSGKATTGVFKKRYFEIEQILKATGRENKFAIMKRLSVLGMIGGVLLAVAIGNYFFIPVLAVGFAMIPGWYVRLTAATHRRQLNEEMETALSTVTTSYIHTEDIIKAVKENLPYINEPLKTHFETFLMETRLINANVVTALDHLKLKIDNAIFHEWVNALIQCQSDRTLIPLVATVTEKFSNVRVVQAELDTLIRAPRSEVITMIILVIANIPLLYFINKDWFYTLTQTTIGQSALAVCAALILFCISKVVSLSRPIEYA